MSMPAIPDQRRARMRIGVTAAVVVVLGGLGVTVLVSALNQPGAAVTVEPVAPVPSAAPEQHGSAIFVHVLGAVTAPGLYELADGARAIDAVAAAGGFADGADEGGVNLARFLSDGEQLYVPAQGEQPPSAPGAVVPGKIDINTADAATLDTLPRLGPAIAERIIQWREANGRFTKVEDLMNVTGIGQKTFDGLRDLITV
ncbi:ComEA family DNA-binding protein [Diaminobutyricimonas sp. LJ205]|uniref:ComEA family DNA-binding protein n=1 Tax=Diaminobutyricimonas sp. LJ205 TaxID=2683590 RepID=UPI0012F4FFED|nr:ComEA family DNA-binding protein [Diaminobutyricimonas sp. LJ205]